MAYPPSRHYYSCSHRLGAWVLRLCAWGSLFFLVLPLLVIVPLSFNAEPFFSFTPGMLRMDPEAYSLRWYQAIAHDQNWLLAVRNSVLIAVCATLLATFLGTLAALGMASEYMPYRRAMTALLVSPLIVPLIIVAAGMFFFYARFNLVGNFPGLIIAHAALGVPFVLITVMATLTGFDMSLYRAAQSLGASPVHAFRSIVLPLIRPGVVSGALFAFATSFDEIVLVLFLAGPTQRTIPRQMFSGLREQIDPTILAVATLLILFSMAFLTVLRALQRGRREPL